MNAKRPSQNLNLLRAYRKRSALSQEEIAFLLGAHKGSKVSRHEQMARDPKLKTALAYEAIFNCPVSELFPGLFEKVKLAVQERAKTLARRALQGNSRSLSAQKRVAVSKIISEEKKKGDKK